MRYHYYQTCKSVAVQPNNLKFRSQFYAKTFLLFVGLIHFGNILAQTDSARVLPELEIQAYRYNRSLLEVPVAVGLLQGGELARFDNTSLLPVVNTVPGVRMEERSPGSYRFSIRGSLVRSPFGVRNVKVYWNGLPMTDGGGNTYLNIVDLAGVGRIEIIKGPGGSLYGAGTGGVILLKTNIPQQSSVELSSMVGSYGLQRHQLRGELNNRLVKGSVNYVHQESDGYREQTAFKRDAINSDWAFILNRKSILSATLFFADVFYETPGGLTKNEFDINPKQARPAAGPNNGAVEQQASVRNLSSYVGLNFDHDWSENWVTRAGLFASYSDFENYSIRNFENRFETNLGGRMETQFSFGKADAGGKLTFGTEFQRFISPFRVYQNNLGAIGERTISDHLNATSALVFLQADAFLPYGFNITFGVSDNFLKYDLERTFPEEDVRDRNFKPVLSPRLAVLKKINQKVSVFGSISKGFSPPTLAEVRPSTEAFNDNLNPEYGVNYEAGVRGVTGKLSFDVTFYDFNLQETIVLQRVFDGAEYFINAGETDQKGIEIAATWNLSDKVKIWTSYNYNHYRFIDYVKDGSDYSGNKLTGVPPTVANLGVDVNLKQVFFNLNMNYTDYIPLNDGNNVYASEYLLSNIKAGYRHRLGEILEMEIFAGVNNLTNESYSLGNDLNAFGGRYYNLAAGRNYFAGLKFKNVFRKA